MSCPAFAAPPRAEPPPPPARRKLRTAGRGGRDLVARKDLELALERLRGS